VGVCVPLRLALPRPLSEATQARIGTMIQLWGSTLVTVGRKRGATGTEFGYAVHPVTGTGISDAVRRPTAPGALLFFTYFVS
jgi:hypothetical protein